MAMPGSAKSGGNNMTSRTFTDNDGYVLDFHDGTIATNGEVALTPNAATNLASKLLEYASRNRVSVRREYVAASEYGGAAG